MAKPRRSKTKSTVELPLDESLTARRLVHAEELLRDLTKMVTEPRRRRRVVDVLLGRLHDYGAGYPASASGRGGAAPGPKQVVVCDEHGVDVDDCRRAGHLGCVGRPVVTADRLGDRLGADGTIEEDRPSEALAEFEATAIEILACLRKLDRIRRVYEPAGAKVRKTASDAPGCDWCATIGEHEDVHTTTKFDTVWDTPLVVPVKLDQQCYRFGRDHGRRPTQEELRYRHGRGQGRWPQRRVTPKRKAS